MAFCWTSVLWQLALQHKNTQVQSCCSETIDALTEVCQWDAEWRSSTWFAAGALPLQAAVISYDCCHQHV
jgi:hypothetical protein